MKKILLTVLTLVLFSATYVSAEEFILGSEKISMYRADSDMTIAFPILNGELWSGGKDSSFENSLYHYYIPESNSPDKPKMFIHFVLWSLNKDDRSNFAEFAKSKYKALVAKELSSLKLEEEITVADDVAQFTTQDGMYNAESIGLQVYSLKKVNPSKDEPAGEDKWTKSVAFNCTVYGLFDSATGKYIVVLGSSTEQFYSGVKTVVAGLFNQIYFGKKSKAGLVALLLILIAVLLAGGGFFFVSEKKKADERKRRLRNLHEDDYDDYDDDDDYDDRSRRGGSREPARSSRGGRSREPERLSRNGRSSRGSAPRRPSRGR